MKTKLSNFLVMGLPNLSMTIIICIIGDNLRMLNIGWGKNTPLLWSKLEQ